MMISKKAFFSLFIVCVTFFASTFAYADKTFSFSNLLWHVRDGFGGPGPNNWSSNNAFVDANGFLHLKITRVNNKWYCPEIYTDKRLGFGKYYFYTIGVLNNLDQNIIFGLFHYTTPDIGPDGTNEIDIEFSRWGDPNFPPGGYTVWPAVTGFKPSNLTFNFTQSGTYTTHGYTWHNDNILFQSGHGHYPNYPLPIKSWRFAPANFTKLIPQHPMPMHINLWLLQGKPPVNGQELELVIKKFCYVPDIGTGNCTA